MGSTQSKQWKATNKSHNRSKTTSPNQEKHNSADSKTPLTRRQPDGADTSATGREDTESESKPEIDEREGHSNVTRAPLPPRLRRLSELIDPLEIEIDSQVRSPSGNLLALEQFLVHPDRPRSIRERQEQIRERVRTASRLGRALGEETAQAQRKETTDKKTKRKRMCSLCGCLSCS